jgi:seryl-tRNA synthetase
MPLDINLFREDRGGDPEKIRESQRRRFQPPESVDAIIAQDNAWRQRTGGIDLLKKERNAVQKQVSFFQ